MNKPGANTQFIVTVDTETYAVGGKMRDFGCNLYGECDGQEFGFPKIMEICDRHGVKATFFVDVYMHHHYGKQQAREVCERISKGGHDVQLHTHTSWLPGSHSGFLYDFSLAQQINILCEGRDLIGEWAGSAPTAFRAGSYSANLDTMRALRENGFVIDSSYFAKRQSCELSRQLGNQYANQQFRIDGILEIPVTTYRLLGNGSYEKLSKLDFNACSLRELLDVTPKLMAGGVRYIVLFLHSFSFIRWKRDFSGIVPNYRALERFERYMRAIAGAMNASFTTMKELAASQEPEPGRDFVPTVSLSGLFPRALQRVLG